MKQIYGSESSKYKEVNVDIGNIFSLCFIKWHRHTFFSCCCNLRASENGKANIVAESLFSFADPPFNVKDCSIAFWIYDAVRGNLWEAKIMSLANTI